VTHILIRFEFEILLVNQMPMNKKRLIISLEFLNYFVFVMRSILRVTKKMKIFKTLITCDPTY